MPVPPVPPGFHTITPYLVVNDAGKLIEFLQRVMDAEVKHISKMPDGTIMHATVQVGDSMLMMTDSRPQMPAAPAMLYLYVPDVDELHDRTTKAGVEWERAPLTQFYGDRAGHRRTDQRRNPAPLTQFYGDRAGCIRDHSGNQWWIASHVEDVSDEQLKIRQRKM